MRLLGLVPNTNKIKIALRLIHACENMDDSNKESFSPNSSQLVMSPMTATTADIDKRILLLTGKNHTMWAFWMKARLLKKDLWRVVDTGPYC